MEATVCILFVVVGISMFDGVLGASVVGGGVIGASVISYGVTGASVVGNGVI